MFFTYQLKKLESYNNPEKMITPSISIVISNTIFH